MSHAAYIPILLALALPQEIPEESQACVDCHRKENPGVVRQWESSKHAANEVACHDCHGTKEGDPFGWKHQGSWVSAVVTPEDCKKCHVQQYREFTGSHHSQAAEHLFSFDNIIGEKAGGMPGNNADAVSGCLQCHGTLVKLLRDEKGEVVRRGDEGRPVIDPETWPNSGVGRFNPDGSRGACNACHSRHTFQTRLSRSPESCGKCHNGPEHPNIEIYRASKHGISFYVNRDRMGLDGKDGWVLGKDYTHAPTCATCHSGGHRRAGREVEYSHDVGARISYTHRPAVSVKQNLVVFEDGYRKDYPATEKLPAVGEEVTVKEVIVEGETLVEKDVKKKVEEIVTWLQRRGKMREVCLSCHSVTHIDDFYAQYDALVDLYNTKFALQGQALLDEMLADGVLKEDAPFQHEVQWTFWVITNHEGRVARLGAAMMSPDHAHTQGMFEVARRFYTEFLPQVIETAARAGPEMEEKYRRKVEELLARPEHTWIDGEGE